MGHLLKLEWMKIRNYRAFMILMGFYVVSIFGINYVVYKTMAPAEDAGTFDMTRMLVGQPFAFPEVWQTVSYLSSFLLFIPGLMIIMLVANEYSFRTNRQNVIDGLSRGQFIGAKIALIFVMALAVTLFVFCMGWLFGISGKAPFSFEGIEYIGYFFISSVLYMSVALVLILLFRRSGVSIGIYFLYIFIVENLLALLINGRIYSGAGYFLPLESADKLIPAPSLLGKILKFDSPDTTYLLISSCVWIVLCLWFCKYRFEKSDL